MNLLNLSWPFLIVLALLITHCIRTGRNSLWIWFMVLAPGIGALAYLAFEFVPSLLGSRGTRRAVRNVTSVLDPGQNLRRYELEVRQTGNVASRQRYADELLRLGRAAEAETAYRAAMTGLYEHDPNLLLGLARAQLAQANAAGARATMEALFEFNPAHQLPDSRLLYARTLEADGRDAQALQEYQSVAAGYAGAEAKLRLAQMLKKLGQTTEARQVLQDVLEHARLAPRHYRRMQADWLAQAQKELAAL
jgi:hypothetical protein